MKSYPTEMFKKLQELDRINQRGHEIWKAKKALALETKTNSMLLLRRCNTSLNRSYDMKRRVRTKRSNQDVLNRHRRLGTSCGLKSFGKQEVQKWV